MAVATPLVVNRHCDLAQVWGWDIIATLWLFLCLLLHSLDLCLERLNTWVDSRRGAARRCFLLELFDLCFKSCVFLVGLEEVARSCLEACLRRLASVSMPIVGGYVARTRLERDGLLERRVRSHGQQMKLVTCGCGVPYV